MHAAAAPSRCRWDSRFRQRCAPRLRCQGVPWFRLWLHCCASCPRCLCARRHWRQRHARRQQPPCQSLLAQPTRRCRSAPFGGMLVICYFRRSCPLRSFSLASRSRTRCSGAQKRPATTCGPHFHYFPSSRVSNNWTYVKRPLVAAMDYSKTGKNTRWCTQTFCRFATFAVRCTLAATPRRAMAAMHMRFCRSKGCEQAG